MTDASNGTTSTGSRALTNASSARAVETFLYSMQDQDFDTTDALMADEIVWHNVGYPIIRGRQRISGLFRRSQGKFGFEVKIHRIAAEGDTVLTERTDVLVFGPVRIQFWVCGVFELQAGKITLWRDYFDNVDFLKATVRGVLGAAIPALRPSL